MPHVSKKRLKKEIAAQLAEHFITFLTTAGSRGEARQLVHELFSQTERVMFAKRLAIAVLLAQGHSFTEIQEALGVTRQTIVRIWRELKGDRYDKILRYAGKRVRRKEPETALDAFMRALRLGLPPRAGHRRSLANTTPRRLV